MVHPHHLHGPLQGKRQPQHRQAQFGVPASQHLHGRGTGRLRPPQAAGRLRPPRPGPDPGHRRRKQPGDQHPAHRSGPHGPNGGQPTAALVPRPEPRPGAPPAGELQRGAERDLHPPHVGGAGGIGSPHVRRRHHRDPTAATQEEGEEDPAAPVRHVVLLSLRRLQPGRGQRVGQLRQLRGLDENATKKINK